MKSQAPTPCSVCAGTLEYKTITYTQHVGERVYLVTDVPAEVCGQCGEEYLSPETVDALEAITNTRKAVKTLTVPVYQFPAAAN